MDCRRCSHRETHRNGVDHQHHCAFTGAQVCEEDQRRSWACPLRLSWSSRDARILSKTVLLQAQKRGKLRELLSLYDVPNREVLWEIYRTQDVSKSVTGNNRNEYEALHRWIADMGKRVTA